jgi:hypothetical protein
MRHRTYFKIGCNTQKLQHHEHAKNFVFFSLSQIHNMSDTYIALRIATNINICSNRNSSIKGQMKHTLVDYGVLHRNWCHVLHLAIMVYIKKMFDH